jgi:hypothetical protein
VAQPLDRRENERQLLDRVHGAAVAPVRLRHLGVAGPAFDGDDRREGAAAGDPGVEARRLGAETGVGLHAAGDGGHATGARRLLVGDGAPDVAPVFTPSRQRLGATAWHQAALHMGAAP